MRKCWWHAILENMKVLLTGATGYIGRRLMERLLAEKHVDLRVFVRKAPALGNPLGKKLDIVEGDTFNTESLDRALYGVHTAYYLIHSMASKKGSFEDLDRKSAENFRQACERNGVQRIIYLGGLGSRESGSRHLKSRMETGDILSASPVKLQTVWFRASIIIGSGGASFEIVRHLVQKLPVMIAPRWVGTVTQPIAVADVLDYLVAAKDLQAKGNLVIDIGAERITFRDMLQGAARAFALKRLIIPVPFFSPKLSLYWLVFITPVPFTMASALVEGLKYETVLMNDNAARLFPLIRPRPFDRMMRDALAEIERDQVTSRWCDHTTGEVCYLRDTADIARAIFTSRGVYHLNGVPQSAVFARVMEAGGEKGWYALNFLWKVRGAMDTLMGGAGASRGRRAKRELRKGDALDFWRVIDLVDNERLLLLSEMHIPGKAWLEFLVSGEQLSVTAFFLPAGLLGRFYWYALLPVHSVLFRRMAKNIVADARSRV